MTGQPLRRRPLRLEDKPRVISNYRGSFWVEKMTLGGPIIETKHSFQEAIKLASWWGAVRKEAAQ